MRLLVDATAHRCLGNSSGLSVPAHPRKPRGSPWRSRLRRSTCAMTARCRTHPTLASTDWRVHSDWRIRLAFRIRIRIRMQTPMTVAVIHFGPNSPCDVGYFVRAQFAGMCDMEEQGSPPLRALHAAASTQPIRQVARTAPEVSTGGAASLSNRLSHRTG